MYVYSYIAYSQHAYDYLYLTINLDTKELMLTHTYRELHTELGENNVKIHTTEETDTEQIIVILEHLLAINSNQGVYGQSIDIGINFWLTQIKHYLGIELVKTTEEIAEEQYLAMHISLKNNKHVNKWNNPDAPLLCVCGIQETPENTTGPYTYKVNGFINLVTKEEITSVDQYCSHMGGWYSYYRQDTLDLNMLPENLVQRFQPQYTKPLKVK